jgi:hypothetical protein
VQHAELSLDCRSFAVDWIVDLGVLQGVQECGMWRELQDKRTKT